MAFFGLFGKKKGAAKTSEDRELVSENERSVNALIVLADGDDVLVEKLKNLQEKLKYLIATDNGKVIDFDKKIRNLIGDLRIALTKADGETNKKVQNLLRDLELTLADRNAKL